MTETYPLTSAGTCSFCGATQTSRNEDDSLYCHQCWRSDAPQSAMLLTQQEWEDLAAMVGSYRASVAEFVNPKCKEFEWYSTLKRRSELAQRIIDAA